MPIATQTIQVRIDGIDAPARACPGPDGVAIGIQRGSEVVDQAPSSAESPQFHATIDLMPREDDVDFRGPYVHGPVGDRFLYLSWVAIPDGGMVARIKLKLADIDPALLTQATAKDAVLTARIRLVNQQGKPVSGSVRPPNVAWSVEREA